MNEPIARQQLAEGHPGGGIAYITTTLQRNAWLRALALTQAGHAIAMLKRSAA